MTDEQKDPPIPPRRGRIEVAPEGFYTSNELMVILGIARPTVAMYKRTGKITPVPKTERKGKRGAELYRGSDVLRYMEGLWDNMPRPEQPSTEAVRAETPFGTYTLKRTAAILRLTTDEVKGLVESKWLKEHDSQFRYEDLIDLLVEAKGQPVYVYWYWNEGVDEEGDFVNWRSIAGYRVGNGEVVGEHGAESIFGFHFAGGPLRLPRIGGEFPDGAEDYRASVWQGVLDRPANSPASG